MTQAKFTNAHLHVFNVACVPKNFLRILPQKTVRKIAPYVLSLLDTWAGRKLIISLAKMGSAKDPIHRKSVDKYIAFLNIGLQNSQHAVFKLDYDVTKAEDAEARMVGLTINMDYMDAAAPPMNFKTQIEDVKTIKRYYAKAFLPFYGVDPRHLSGEQGLNNIRREFENILVQEGEAFPYFSGLKLYPALGFFPFDRRLEQIYAYAEKNRLPIMTHCTRVGTQYIGSNIESLIPLHLDLLYPANLADPAQQTIDTAVRQSLEKRIAKYYEKGWVKNSKIGDNDYACDLFGHPENYIPLLLRYPQLKICLAHMGGSTEIDASKPDKTILEIRQPDCDPQLWFDRIKEMMIRYENLYTDISYTLGSFGEDKEVVINRSLELMRTKDLKGNELAYRVLFGTDFFMTEQEMREAELIALAKNKLSGLQSASGDNYWTLLTKVNPDRYLRQ